VQDRPDAEELGAALARFLLEQVRPAVPRELRFQLLVAANTAAILGREAAVGDAPVAERARLARLVPDLPEDVRAAQGELARAIRAGAVDDRWDEAVAVLRDSVRAKLAVAHPGYDGLADDGRA
jgi:hypothetical protein